MLLESLPADEIPAGVPKTGMALRAKHVGQFGPHKVTIVRGGKTMEMTLPMQE